MKERIDEIFALWTDGVCPGGQVAVRCNGEMIYDRCFGYADVENKLPVTHDSVFHVASVSKQLTVMAVLLLQEDGVLDIDTDVRAYIPQLIRFDEPVTVRNLMNNVSGIRDIWELQELRGVRIDDTITQHDAVRVIANQTQLNFPPETRYMYSNSNFVLLSEIVEKLSGMSLNNFLRKRIFNPLGMTNTVIRERYWQRIDNRARSFYDNGSEYFHSVLNYGSYGSTSLHTTAHDFMKWMKNYKNPTICKQETIDIMLTAPVLKGNAPTIYAGGLMVDELEGRRRFYHGGADAAFRSIAMRLPDDDIDIVILCNTQNTPTLPAADAIARILLGLDPAPRAVLDVQEDFDEREAPGFYYADLPDAVTVKVIKKEDGLYMADCFEDAPLQHIRGGLYRVGHLDNWLSLGKKPAFVMAATVTQLEKASPSPVPTEQLLRYEGRYESSEIETAYEVIEQDGKLYIDHFRHGLARLYLVAHDRFVSDGTGSSPFIQFTRGSGGTVIGMTMSCGRVQNLPFSKVD